jgi:uncharacterized damage-inducible protein DinB
MKQIRLAVAGALALPAALAAQNPSSPTSQAAPNPITAQFKAFHTRYGAWLTAAFDSIPASKYGYKPTPSQQTIGYIAQHLEDANYQLCALMNGDKRALTAKDSSADTIKAMWPKDTLTARLKASFTYCDGALSRVEDVKLADAVPVGPAAAGRTVPRARLLILYVTDLADHYSQIANYMRLNGMVPPSAQARPNR